MEVLILTKIRICRNSVDFEILLKNRHACSIIRIVRESFLTCFLGSCMIKYDHKGDTNMVSKETKLFYIGDNGYRFDSNSFNTYFKSSAKENEVKIGDFEEKIADELFITKEAVHNWRFGSNGPGSLEIIKKLANIISISDYTKLLKKHVEVNKMEEYSTLKIESMKRVYDAIIEFLHDFLYTGGFTTDLWYKFADMGSSDPENDIYEYAENKMHAIELILEKEYFYLHDTKVYSELCEYVDNDLWDTFNGKVSYAYRFEAIPDGNPTTQEDYYKALNRINEIIEQYV